MTSLQAICGLPPSPPNQNKNHDFVYGYLLPVITFDVIGQFYVRLFFGLELVLVIIRVGAKFVLYI